MEIIFTILTAAFIALMIGFALTFGFALFTVLLVTGVVLALISTGYGYWRRWRFVDYTQKSERNPQVIEAEYTDITKEQ